MPFRSSARGAYGPQGQKVLKGPLAPVWVTFSPGPVGTSAFSYTFVATDDSGDAPTYSLASGTLPNGLTLNSSTGVLSGTATVSGTFTYTLRATDVNGRATDTTSISQVVTLRSAGTYTLAQATALGSYVVGDTINISYTGSAQTLNKFNATSVKLICRGAAGAGFSGSGQARPGGAGGYAEGVYAIGGNIYAYVGGGGGTAVANNDANGGFNGGGFAPGSGANGENRNGSGGGGTDFRTTVNDTYSNRVIVAGGGGGGNAWSSDTNQCSSGGAGGGTNGNNGSTSNQNSNVGGGGTQSSGGTAAPGGTGTGSNGGFGVGGAGYRINTSDPSGPGGGGGWYGGGAGAAQNEAGAGGGSGYIGGVTSGVLTTGGGTASSASDWSTNSQGNGSAQVVILAVA